MSIVKELNELAEKITGENPKEKTIGESLDYIEQNYTAGGGSSSGGSSAESDIFVIKGNKIGQDYTIDKTFAEMEKADQEGKILFLRVGSIFTFLSYVYNMETNKFYFAGSYSTVVQGILYVDEVAITSDNKVTVTSNEYTLTPASSTPVLPTS